MTLNFPRVQTCFFLEKGPKCKKFGLCNLNANYDGTEIRIQIPNSNKKVYL
jgi:hypothetical protein